MVICRGIIGRFMDRPVEILDRFPQFTESIQGQSLVQSCVSEFWFDMEGLVKRKDSLAEHLNVGIRESLVVKCEGIFRIIDQRLVKSFEGFFVSSEFLEGKAPVKVTLGITGIILEIAIKRFDRFGISAQFEVRITQVIIGFRVRRFRPKGPGKRVNRFLVPADLCQRSAFVVPGRSRGPERNGLFKCNNGILVIPKFGKGKSLVVLGIAVGRIDLKQHFKNMDRFLDPVDLFKR